MTHFQVELENEPVPTTPKTPKSPNSIGIELIKKSESDLELRDKDRDTGVIQVSIETKFDDPRKMLSRD